MSGQAASTRSPKVGLFLPTGELMAGGATAGWAELLNLARRAEDLGFDSLWVPDHFLLGSDGDSEAIGGWECWSLLAALAATTSRVELGALVSCTGYRNPALLAKVASTVDEISDGRLVLGIGAGWAESEFRAFGFPFDHRVARFQEAIQIVTGLLRHGRLDFQGTYYSVRDCELRPRGPTTTWATHHGRGLRSPHAWSHRSLRRRLERRLWQRPRINSRIE